MIKYKITIILAILFISFVFLNDFAIATGVTTLSAPEGDWDVPDLNTNTASIPNESDIFIGGDNNGNRISGGWVGLEALIKRITDFIFFLALIFAPLTILAGAFMYMTSAGDSNRVSTAKKIMIWAIIGLVIAGFGKLFLSIFKFIVQID